MKVLESNESRLVRLPEAPSYTDFLALLHELETAVVGLQTVYMSFDDLIKLGLIMKEIDKNCLPFQKEAKQRIQQMTMTSTLSSRSLANDLLKIVHFKTLSTLLPDIDQLKAASTASEDIIIRHSKYPEIICTKTYLLEHIKKLITAYQTIITLLAQAENNVEARLALALSLVPSLQSIYHLLAIARSEKLQITNYK